jgi:hypothetical protein
MRFLILFAALAATVTPAQDRWKEASSFSGIDLSPPQALANGAINCSRVPISGSTLNIGTESNYLLPLPPDQAAGIIHRVENNSTEIDNLISKPVSPENFNKLTVTDSSLKNTKSLNFSGAEKQQLTAVFQSGSTDQINTLWRTLLLNRCASFQANGLIKAEPYDFGNTSFQPAPELVGLLKQRSPVLKRFVNIMDEIMTGKPVASEPVIHYWQNEKIQGNQNLGLGSIHTQKTATGYQLADITYYSASSYFISITLYEFWPVQVNGENQTYVWRGDYVISPSIGYTKGIERMAAENIMILEVKSAIRDQIRNCAKAK